MRYHRPSTFEEAAQSAAGASGVTRFLSVEQMFSFRCSPGW